MSWQEEAQDLKFNQGKSWTETAAAVAHYFPGMDKQKVWSKVRDALRLTEQYKTRGEVAPEDKKEPKMPLLDALKKCGELSALAEKLGVSRRVAEAMIQDAKDSGYNIEGGDNGYQLSHISLPKENRVTKPWTGEKIIRFGLMGDTQLGCVDTQITHLHTLYDRYQSEGITQVYHTGDMTDGEKMRPGHEYELYVHGADAQAAHAVNVYPKRPGMVTDFITGNHDYSFIKTIGLDIGRQIANQRPDMNYLGYMSAMVELSPKCTLELRHPQDGTAYALSYKIQKIIEAMSSGEKPHILAVGHYHKMEQLFYRNVHAFQTSCTCAQTNWMRGKNIAASVGGWLIEAYVDDEGTITRIKPEFFPFYKMVKDDYKNWL